MNAMACIPAFDPDSKDADLLEAYARVQTLRAFEYSFDAVPEDQAPAIELADAHEQALAAAMIVEGDFATTIPGIIARLLLVIPGIEQDRWVDRGLTEQGFLALYRERERFDGNTQQIIHAVHELTHLEWEQNLAAYERVRDDFKLVLKGKNLVEEAGFGGDQSSFLQAISEHSIACEQRFTSCSFIRRLIRTLAPDRQAFLRKVQVIIAEGWSDEEDPSPWLARDANFLIGRIDFPEGEA